MSIPNSVDAMLISNSINIGYLTDFWGSYGRILILKNEKKILISDSRYSEIAKKCAEKHNAEYREISKNQSFWKELCAEFAIQKLGIEKEGITLEQFELMQKGFEETTLDPMESPIPKMRIIKSADEIEKLQHAALIADQALEETIKHFRMGISEKELAWIFEKTAREQFGADALSFDTIVAFGEHSAIPHHFPTEKKLKDAMPILIDCGVKKDHYCSDMTRCFWFGEKSGEEYDEWEKTYDLVMRAQQAGIKEIKVGNAIWNAEKKAREVLGENEKYFGHSFGHGVGLEIHEAPHVSSKNKDVFEEGNIITAEPGIYFPGKFGIRIEDLLVVETTGTRCLSVFWK